MKLGFIGLCCEEFSSTVAESQMLRLLKKYYDLGYREFVSGVSKAEESVLVRTLMDLYEEEDYKFKTRLIFTVEDFGEFYGTEDPMDMEIWNMINSFANSKHIIYDGVNDIDYYYHKTNRILDEADKYIYCYNHPQLPERLFFSELPYQSGYGNPLNIEEVRRSLTPWQRFRL